MGCGAGQSASPAVAQPLKPEVSKVEGKPGLGDQKSPSSVKNSGRDQKEKLNTSKSSINQSKTTQVKKSTVSLTKSPSAQKTLTKSVSKDKNLTDKTAVGTNGTSQSNRSSVKNLTSSNMGISPSKVKLQVGKSAIQNQQVQEVNAEKEQDSNIRASMKKSKSKKKKPDPKINELMRLYGI